MAVSMIYRTLRTIALSEFGDVVVSAEILRLPSGDPKKLRLDIVDGSLLDVYSSISGRYSYHWERRMTPAADLYRFDNAPHKRWRFLSSFPNHFHDGSENNVLGSDLSETPDQAVKQVLSFVRRKLTSPEK